MNLPIKASSDFKARSKINRRLLRRSLSPRYFGSCACRKTSITERPVGRFSARRKKSDEITDYYKVFRNMKQALKGTTLKKAMAKEVIQSLKVSSLVALE